MDISSAVPPPPVIDEKGVEVKDSFLQFLREWYVQNSSGQQEYPYQLQVKDMLENEDTTLYVNYEHLLEYSEQLASIIQQEYYRFDPFLRESVRKFVADAIAEHAVQAEQTHVAECTVAFHSLPTVHSVRDLKTDLVGKLISIRGTVVRTSAVHPELVRGAFMCMDCSAHIPDVEQQFRFTEPIRCRNPQCDNRQRFKLKIDGSKFVDFQKVRIQESSDEIPSGSMPRSVDIILRHQSVEKAKAGDKAVFTGSLVVVPDVAQLSGSAGRTSIISGGSREGYSEEGITGLKQLGVRDLTYKLSFLGTTVVPKDVKFGVVNVRDEDASMTSVLQEFTEEQRAKILAMRHDPDLYRKLTDSIAPTVFGHDEVKRGVLLMLFGGVHKTTLEGISLRGDINVCIVGDPSTAKSQFLKYVTEFVPRSVYTSGKASSAAGLTAAVVRDEDSNEFYIEAGALMLADNGICCIDEFDKMDQRDQVAIHEAMEQQTISITKAGIQATLNARTSVLAAANPINGRYDKSKTLRSNVAMTSPIMSRFDLFFVILDECDEVTDYNIARHITNMHQRLDDAVAAEYTTEDLQRYIKFARTLSPTVTDEARQVMIHEYRKLREGDMTSNKSSYRITVRQLESMIRLSEALARMHCQTNVTPMHVNEACRLLRKSIIHVESEDVTLSDDVLNAQPGRTAGAQTDGTETDASQRTATTVPESEPVAPPAPNQAKTVSYEKYMRVSYEIVHYIRQRELEADSPETFTGVSRHDVIEWYLKEHEREFETLEAAAEEADVLRLIIGRMISTDNVILQIDNERSTDDKLAMLAVHPNYNPDE